jgi:hypothetical protein
MKKQMERRTALQKQAEFEKKWRLKASDFEYGRIREDDLKDGKKKAVLEKMKENQRWLDENGSPSWIPEMGKYHRKMLDGLLAIEKKEEKSHQMFEKLMNWARNQSTEVLAKLLREHFPSMWKASQMPGTTSDLSQVPLEWKLFQIKMNRLHQPDPVAAAQTMLFRKQQHQQVPVAATNPMLFNQLSSFSSPAIMVAF